MTKGDLRRKSAVRPPIGDRPALARRARSGEGRQSHEALLKKYLPPAFYGRLPHSGASWRGRTALFLWALGYPLEMAWSTAMTRDAQHASDFKRMMARLEDDRLIAQLDATADVRGDGRHLEFVSFGLIRRGLADLGLRGTGERGLVKGVRDQLADRVGDSPVLEHPLDVEIELAPRHSGGYDGAWESNDGGPQTRPAVVARRD